MKLLTFAHRGEAQAFLSSTQYRQVDFFFDGLLKSEDSYLLITGEGPQAATEKTICVLSQFSSEIDEVINLGVAGSLNSKIKKHDLIWIRTAYAKHAEKLEFKSFSSPSSKANHDCITSFTRVLDSNEKKELSLFADLVDRELWAVASAAHLFKKAFRSLKIISDDMDSSENDICKLVKEEASVFSEKLFLEFNQSDSKTPHLSPTPRNDFLTDKSFYFTVSQQRILSSTVKSLSLKGVSPDSLYQDHYILSLKEEEMLPKERSKLLLQYLSEKLNPISLTIRKNIEEALAPLKEAHIQVNYDNDFEEEWLNLSTRIQSTRDLEKVKNALKIFSYEDFKKILDGQFDV